MHVSCLEYYNTLQILGKHSLPLRSDYQKVELSKGKVKHLLLAKFKEGLSGQQIEEYIKQYANLVNLIPSIEAFEWDKDVSFEKLLGFTHVFESSFETTEGVAEYLVHPHHVSYANFTTLQL